MRMLAIGLGTLALVSGAFAEQAKVPAAAPALAGNPGAASDQLPAFGFFGRTKGMTRVVPASEVWESIHSGGNKYFVVDVRPAEDHAKGHIPGAISMPIDVLFRPANLAKLPGSGKPILLVCHSGHVESMALGGLAALGYEPYVMRFGMIGWNAESKVKAGSPDQEGDTVRGLGGPIEK